MPVNKLTMPRIVQFAAMQKGNQYPRHRKFVASMHKQNEAGVFNITSKTVQRNVEYLNTDYSAHIRYGYQQHICHHEKVFRMSMPWEVTVPVPNSLRDEARTSAMELLRMNPEASAEKDNQ